MLLLLGRQTIRFARSPRRPRGELRDIENPKLWKAIEPPTGRLAERAWSLAKASQPEWLQNHGLRTYAWAQALGVIGGLEAHDECLFAASVLHDAGLTPAAATPSEHCFAIRGARYARQALAPVGSESVEIVAHAIARHLDLVVPVGDGVEAHLLQAGAAVDVLGQGLARIPPVVREHVLHRHPRQQMKKELCRCMQQVAATAPSTRAGFYVRRIGFINLIERSPFEE
ncbi:HD domain-containing protein [Aquabacterium sp. A7-Y]|uniref:HD domain-containing protein n=1 Tax=Aquabacterium sp. A7-Y TaxID=1349605 RepID=UPI00223CED10|nr:HD domain-containing protein [Aquabacterium sp. A7-Y]MCW7536742.1 HD domain-containing protein [Aquabacterium sp. A7-Y]